MTAARKSVLFAVPRLLTLLFGIFTSMFAMDVFREGLGLWAMLGALVLRLVPTGLILLVLALAWHHGWVGAIAYTAFGLFVASSRAGDRGAIAIAGFMVALGLLFLADWLNTREA